MKANSGIQFADVSTDMRELRAFPELPRLPTLVASLRHFMLAIAFFLPSTLALAILPTSTITTVISTYTSTAQTLVYSTLSPIPTGRLSSCGQRCIVEFNSLCHHLGLGSPKLTEECTCHFKQGRDYLRQCAKGCMSHNLKNEAMRTRNWHKEGRRSGKGEEGTMGIKYSWRKASKRDPGASVGRRRVWQRNNSEEEKGVLRWLDMLCSSQGMIRKNADNEIKNQKLTKRAKPQGQLPTYSPFWRNDTATLTKWLTPPEEKTLGVATVTVPQVVNITMTYTSPQETSFLSTTDIQLKVGDVPRTTPTDTRLRAGGTPQTTPRGVNPKMKETPRPAPINAGPDMGRMPRTSSTGTKPKISEGTGIPTAKNLPSYYEPITPTLSSPGSAVATTIEIPAISNGNDNGSITANIISTITTQSETIDPAAISPIATKKMETSALAPVFSTPSNSEPALSPGTKTAIITTSTIGSFSLLAAAVFLFLRRRHRNQYLAYENGKRQRRAGRSVGFGKYVLPVARVQTRNSNNDSNKNIETGVAEPLSEKRKRPYSGVRNSLGIGKSGMKGFYSMDGQGSYNTFPGIREPIAEVAFVGTPVLGRSGEVVGIGHEVLRADEGARKSAVIDLDKVEDVPCSAIDLDDTDFDYFGFWDVESDGRIGVGRSNTGGVGAGGRKRSSAVMAGSAATRTHTHAPQKVKHNSSCVGDKYNLVDMTMEECDYTGSAYGKDSGDCVYDAPLPPYVSPKGYDRRDLGLSVPERAMRKVTPGVWWKGGGEKNQGVEEQDGKGRYRMHQKRTSEGEITMWV